MEQRIVAKEESKYIYWIKNNNDEFYLTIPITKKANLVLNLLNNVDDEIVKGVKEEKDHITVTPKLSQESVMGLKQNSAEAFTAVAESLARDINLSHQILTYNKLELEPIILINNNPEFQIFATWFMKKHAGKVQLNEQPKQEEVILPPPQPVKQPEQEIEELPIKEEVPAKTLTREKSFGFVSYVLLGVVVVIASLLFLYYIL